MKLFYVAILASCFGFVGYLAGQGECMRPVVIEATCLPQGEWPPVAQPKPVADNTCTRTRLPAMPEKLRATE